MISAHQFKMVAKTQQGLEDVLMRELSDIGAENIQPLTRAVSFTGDLSILYKANLWCRTALKIMKPIKSFPAENEEQLYEATKKIEWEELMDVGETLAVEAVLHQSNLNHSMYAALKVKDAVVDRFRAKFGERPSVDTAEPTLKIHVHISRDECTLYLDSSGDSLHRRGYRDMQHEAPLNEVLAAGLVLKSGWDAQSNFIDFMCGTGTLLIEAAMIAKNIAPGLTRKQFAFERWHNFNADLWREIKEEAIQNQLKELSFPITGCDVSRNTAEIARQNIENMGLSNDIKVQNMDFSELEVPPAPGIVISNPPYGERIQVVDLNLLYSAIGDTLKRKYKGYKAWLFTGNKEAMKHIGLRASKKLTFLNGPIECKFLRFDLY